MVELTYDEHLEAHIILTECLKASGYKEYASKMKYASDSMKHSNKTTKNKPQNSDRYFKSRIAELKSEVKHLTTALKDAMETIERLSCRL